MRFFQAREHSPTAGTKLSWRPTLPGLELLPAGGGQEVMGVTQAASSTLGPLMPSPLASHQGSPTATPPRAPRSDRVPTGHKLLTHHRSHVVQDTQDHGCYSTSTFRKHSPGTTCLPGIALTMPHLLMSNRIYNPDPTGGSLVGGSALLLPVPHPLRRHGARGSAPAACL